MSTITFPKDEAIDDGMPVTVVFRRWKPTGHTATPQAVDGAIIALFPFMPASITNAQDECMSYEHVGQHGAAEYQHVIDNSDAVDLDDEANNDARKLYGELTLRGYALSIMTNEQACFEAGFKAGQKDSE